MKNKRIRFDDRFYWTTLNIALFVLVLFFLLLMIKNNAPLGICVFLSIVFSLFLCGLYVFPKMGLYFNYRLGIIKYLGPHKIEKRLIKMLQQVGAHLLCMKCGMSATERQLNKEKRLAAHRRAGKCCNFLWQITSCQNTQILLQ